MYSSKLSLEELREVIQQEHVYLVVAPGSVACRQGVQGVASWAVPQTSAGLPWGVGRAAAGCCAGRGASLQTQQSHC